MEYVRTDFRGSEIESCPLGSSWSRGYSFGTGRCSTKTLLEVLANFSTRQWSTLVNGLPTHCLTLNSDIEETVDSRALSIPMTNARVRHGNDATHVDSPDACALSINPLVKLSKP